jgi:lipopolysaccharide transport system permease protein
MNEITIEAGRVQGQYWRDLWRYRELLCFLAWRDILVRYKQTLIGVAWSVIRPLLTMIVLTFIFGRLAKMPSGGVPYPIFVFCGMLPWQFFSAAFTESGNSLVLKSGMISKVYFPRLLIPLGSVITSFIDFIISAILLIVIMFYYGFVPSQFILILPFFVMMAFFAAIGVGFWVSALMVKYRDFRFIVPFLVQFGLYLSPVGFSSKMISSGWNLLYSVNPMVGIINGFRWSILGTEKMDWISMIISASGIILMTISGFMYFRSNERKFADVI